MKYHVEIPVRLQALTCVLLAVHLFLVVVFYFGIDSNLSKLEARLSYLESTVYTQHDQKEEQK